MKKCSKCGILKKLEFFNKDKSSKDSHRSNCKDCSKSYRDNNKEKEKIYREENKEKIKEQYESWYSKNKDRIKEVKSKYYELNKEVILEKSSLQYQRNRSKKLDYQKDYQSRNKDKRNKYLSERRKNNVLFRLITNIRNLINNSFYEVGFSKKSRTHEILGCSFDEFKNYLESNFEVWMNWENRGIYTGEFNVGWDIDHIIPLSSASNEEDLVKLNHYTNLRPLCTKINRDIKKDKIEYGII
jgi:hypothetical protein